MEQASQEHLKPLETESATAVDLAPAPSRTQRIFGPVVAGMVLDFADLLTFGPFRMMFGVLLGGAVAYYLCHVSGLSWQSKLLGAVAGAVYCVLPLTGFLPRGTLLGAYIRYRQTAQ